MGVSKDGQRQSPVPSFVYSGNRGCFQTQTLVRRFPIEAPKENIKMYSPAFYAACTAGGILSCGLTHMAVTPLDLVKCNMQVTNNIPCFEVFNLYNITNHIKLINLDRPSKVQEYLVWFWNSAKGAGSERVLPGLGANVAWLQCSGCLQVWILRVLQEVLF